VLKRPVGATQCGRPGVCSGMQTLILVMVADALTLIELKIGDGAKHRSFEIMRRI
jgi:hypothetical protein